MVFSALVLLLGGGSAARGQEVLQLSDPHYCACGWVSVNGYVHSDNKLYELVWDWGDGSRNTSWFPSPHRYAANGTYLVTVIAAGCTTETATIELEVTNANDPGCPTDSAPDCFAYPCRYVFPYNLHLINGQTSSLPLQLRGSDGTPLSDPVTFTPTDKTLVSVAASGYVTALRQEADNEIGAWINADWDGQPVANSCVARVLPKDYGIHFIDSTGEHTVLHYPAAIKGENLDELVQDYQIPTVNEYAYRVEQELIGTRPFGGCRQVFEVDLGVSEANRVCGISGNPIRLGWNIEGNEWQNCFLVPFLAPRSPQWGVFYHELGHNFTWSSGTFAEGVAIGPYTEGLATAIELAAIHRILANPAAYPVQEETRFSMQYIYDRDTDQYRTAFQGWLDGGADFSVLNPDIVDGLWLHHAGGNLERFASRFFMPLDTDWIDSLSGILCGIDSEAKKHTFFAALVSAAAGEDLSSTFSDVYHYPVDQALFSSIFDACNGIINSRAAGDLPGQGGAGPPLWLSKSDGGAITLSWGSSCLDSDFDFAVYEGILGRFYSHASRLCSTSGEMSATLVPAEGNTYYLVVPRNDSREGSYGTDSSGNGRPPGAAACVPQLVAFCP